MPWLAYRRCLGERRWGSDLGGRGGEAKLDVQLIQQSLDLLILVRVVVP